MSDITIDPRDEFEKVFPLPMYVIRCGKGYACTEYNAWGAHDFIRQWEGWSAAMLQGKDFRENGNSSTNNCRENAETSTNSPVIPDGYALVPIEPTEEMMLHKSGCQHHAWDDPDCAMRQTRRLVWSHMLEAVAPQREVE